MGVESSDDAGGHQLRYNLVPHGTSVTVGDLDGFGSGFAEVAATLADDVADLDSITLTISVTNDDDERVTAIVTKMDLIEVLASRSGGSKKKK